MESCPPGILGEQFYWTFGELNFSPIPGGFIQMGGLKFFQLFQGITGFSQLGEKRGGDLSTFSTRLSFSYWPKMYSSLPHQEKSSPPPSSLPPLKKFSCYSPIKTLFLPVVIAAAPFILYLILYVDIGHAYFYFSQSSFFTECCFQVCRKV